MLPKRCSTAPRRRSGRSAGAARGSAGLRGGERRAKSQAKRKPHHCGFEGITGSALRYAAFGSVDRERLLKRVASDARSGSRLWPPPETLSSL